MLFSVVSSGARTPLRALHEALFTGPISRKVSRADLSWPSDGAEPLLHLNFDVPELQGSTASKQLSLVRLALDAAAPTASIVAPALPADTSVKAVVRKRAEAGAPELEMRLLSSTGKDGTPSVAAEVWSGGVRLARRGLSDLIGGTVLNPAIFGSPTFSPSGRALAWVAEAKAEETPKGAGYWPAPSGAPASRTVKAVRAGSGAADKEADASKEKGKALTTDAVARSRFDLKRNLGETIGVRGAQLVVWEWARDVVSVLEAEALLPPGTLGPQEVAVPAQLAWDGTDDGLLFACHLLPPRLPGLSACLNRPTRLYHLPSHTAEAPVARCLTDGLYLSHMPRLSPDGATLAFVCAPAPFASHSTNFEVRTMAWPPPPAGVPSSRIVADAVAGRVARGVWSGLCGFHPQLDALSWLDGERGASTLVAATISAAEHSIFLVDAAASVDDAAAPPRRLTPPGFSRGSTELLAVRGGLLVVQVSSLTDPPAVWACRPGLDGASDRWVQVSDPASTPTAHLGEEVGRLLEVLRGTSVSRVALPDAEGGAEALVVQPASDGASRLPWVLRPHGGTSPPRSPFRPRSFSPPCPIRPSPSRVSPLPPPPPSPLHPPPSPCSTPPARHSRAGPHSAAVDAFSVQDALLLASGVALVFPNYRGSLGYGGDFVASLLGKVGERDVDDCAALLRLALAENEASLDPARGACYGGSHGGFLTAWLLGSDTHRSLFSCGTLWNPVVDLPAMLGTTDIPEWCAAEGYGSAAFRWPLSPAQLSELYARSPISKVDNVAVPSLMLLGAADSRVPPTQGRQYVAALQELPHAPEVACLEYEGEGHALGGTEAQAHAVQTLVCWLLDHLGASSGAE